jgi:hypothetical protein
VAYEQAAYEGMALPLMTSSNVQTLSNLNLKIMLYFMLGKVLDI